MHYPVSVIIRTKNESHYLGRVLQRLGEQKYPGAVEIIVVDSGSTDSTVRIAEDFGCRIIQVKPEDFSFGRALNIGIEYASSSIVINLSGHSVPETTDYLDLMVRPFADHFVAATFGRDIPWPEACPSQARDISNHFPEVGPDGNKFSNANAALRKTVWEKIKFDEDIPAAEDLLWARQVMNAGHRIHYIPEARVYHSHTSSLRYSRRRAYIESRSINSFDEKKYHFGVLRFAKFMLRQTTEDMIFSLRNRYSLLWLLHIPLYRFAQGIGYFRGFRDGAGLHIDTLSKTGEYAFQETPRSGKRKVLMVVLSFLPESAGGTEYYTLTLAKALASRGWEVKVVSAVRDITQQRYKVRQAICEGIEVIKVNNPPEFYTRYVDYFIDHTVDHIFGRILKAEKPDLVHFQHTAYLSSRLPEVAHQLKVPSVFTLHDYWYMCHRSQLLRPAEGICPGPSGGIYCATCYDPARPNQAGVPKFPFVSRVLQMSFVRRLNIKEWLSPGIKQKLKKLLYKGPAARSSEPNESTISYPSPELWSILEHSFRLGFMKRQLTFPAAVISPSLHLKKRYEAEGFREIAYVPHGFEPREKIPRPPFTGSLLIAYVGNITPVKGADILLRELKFVSRRQNIRLVFYGKVLDAIYQQKLETAAKDYPDVDISFKGPYKSSDLGELLADVHLVVFPSIWEENHPLVIREALLHGVPVIASSWGGAPEAIEEGTNGFTFDPYKEGELAARIDFILENPETLDQLAKGARNSRIESMEDHAGQIIGIYDASLRRPFEEVKSGK